MATDQAIQGDLECSAAQLERQISWVQHLLSWVPPQKKWLVIAFIPDHCHWRMAKHPYLMSSHVFHAQMDNCIAILQYPIFWVLKNLCLSPRFIHRPQFTGFLSGSLTWSKCNARSSLLNCLHWGHSPAPKLRGRGVCHTGDLAVYPPVIIHGWLEISEKNVGFDGKVI